MPYSAVPYSVWVVCGGVLSHGFVYGAAQCVRGSMKVGRLVWGTGKASGRVGVRWGHGKGSTVGLCPRSRGCNRYMQQSEADVWRVLAVLRTPMGFELHTDGFRVVRYRL